MGVERQTKVKNNSKLVNLSIGKNGLAFIEVGKTSGVAGFKMELAEV